MKSKSDSELSKIDLELKEAVCDALVNALVDRVSGADERGRFVLGGSPRRGIFAGQLLPRFDSLGVDDETTDIRIAAVGIDLVIASESGARVCVTPRFAAYVRVLPMWRDLVPGGGDLEFDFRLRPSIQQQIDDTIRIERALALQEAGLERPAWKTMDETKRSKIRAARAEILGEVRKNAYAAHRINLQSHDFDGGAPDVQPTDPTVVDPNSPDTPAEPAPPIARLVRDGRELPLNLVDPAPVPGKWRRLDLRLPALEFDSNSCDADLLATIDRYNGSMAAAVASQLEAWAAGEGVAEAWRDTPVQPGDTLNEGAWTAALAAMAARPVDRSRVIPDLSRVAVKVERQVDFMDPRRTSMRVMLDNQSRELLPQDARGRCNTIFKAGLAITMPKAAHLSLRLDRVEPSYRFREHLDYPAIGLNCGVQASTSGQDLTLCTTSAPRFAQPRIAPSNIEVPYQFSVLKDPGFDASRLLALPRSYASWIDAQELRLKDAVTEGLDARDAQIEAARFSKDVAAQRDEARYIARGVELLIASKKAFDALSTASTDNRATLDRRAAPWRAWTMTNEAFALRDSFDAGRGWRLFQMAFVLSHIPVFASRMDEWREYHDPLLDEDGVSLLYFPTGGGKSEAFYGTLLFAMFLDRLRGKDRGVTAMIRYPLRLLTLQQAQRLLKLIVRAEMVRKRHCVGSWPFEMGFWVGGQNTPNHYREFKAEVPLIDDPDFPNDDGLDGESGDDEQRDRGRRYVGAREAFDKIPNCPICGRPTGLRRDETNGPFGKRAAIVCFNDRCDWNREHGRHLPLPFLLTDDAIYARAPAIVLGTVDKLAMLGQNTNTISKLLGMFGLARRMDRFGNLASPRSEEDLRRDPEADGSTNVYPRTLPAYIYLLLHTLSHQMMHSLADTSGVDRDGIGEHIFPADLSFVIYRKGMTPDLGNISAMWRNYSEAFLKRALDPRTLRCGSGSLCDTRGGACPACIMVSEVSCIASNLLLSRAVLKGGKGPEWEPKSAPNLIGYFDPSLS